MSIQILGSILKRLVNFLEDKKVEYALVGGLAVSFRTLERATKDIDIAIAVDSDATAEKLIREFSQLDFQPATLLENKLHKRISTVRLLSNESPNVFVDILFSTSGIEKEVCDSAEKIEILPDLELKVATLASLIAMKVLSSTNIKRKQDILDLSNLISDASSEDLQESKHLISLIESRNYNEGFNLSEIFKKLND